MRKILKEQIFRMLEDEMRRRQRALNENRHAIKKMAKDQKNLKKEFFEINNFLWELRRAP